METQVLWIVSLGITLLVGAFLLLLPFIARSGLLLGVYVGEETARGPEARRITRGWSVGMGLTLATSLLLGAGLWLLAPPHPLGAIAPVILLTFGQIGCYLRGYRAARRLAVNDPPPAAAVLIGDPPGHLSLPIAALVLAVLAGMAALLYTVERYPDLPARVPTHFGPSGAPDAWSARSIGSVFILPILNLVMAVMLGGISCLMVSAKRAIRHPDGGASVEAQARFRRAMSKFMAGITLLTAGLLTSMAIGSVRVAVGEAERLPWPGLALGGVLLAWALGGSLWMAWRYGQGGSRLEGRHTSAPLTDGLADNRNWILGMIYVNRDDPSFLVERRFGLGYTLNLGNPRAWLAVAVFTLLIFGSVLLAIFSSRP